MKANSLNLKHIKSEVKPYCQGNDGELEDFLSKNFEDSSFFVAYLDYCVLIGRWENKLFKYGAWEDDEFNIFTEQKFPLKYIQKIRVFNNKQELYIWRSKDEFKGRFRKDYTNSDSDKIGVVIAEQVLFGTDIRRKCKGNCTEITEDRGTTLVLPFSQSDIKVNEKEQRVFIKTHNYLDSKSVHATYVDCRFVCFTYNNKELQ